MQVKVLGHMANQFSTYLSICIDIWIHWGMKNHKTVMKSMFIDE